MSGARSFTSRCHPDQISPARRRLFQLVHDGKSALEDEIGLVQAMAHDPAFHVWVLTELETITLLATSREDVVSHRLLRVIGSCQQYSLARAAEKPEDVTEAEKRSLFLFHFMLAPINASPHFVNDQVREALNSGLDVYQFIMELHQMRALLSEPRQAALSAWAIAYQSVLTTNVGNRPHLNAQSQKIASQSSSAKEDTQVGSDPARKSIPTTCPYDRGDSIDRVANRKAGRQEVIEFKKKLAFSIDLHRQVKDRIRIYESRSEEAKRMKLVAILNAVEGSRGSDGPSAASGTSEGRKEQHSNKPATASSESHSRATKLNWEVEFAKQHHQAARQTRKQCKAIDRTGKVMLLADASRETQDGVRNMHFLAEKMINSQIRHFFPRFGKEALGPRATDAIQAMNSLHFEHGRLAELQMLAAVSGKGVFESTEELIQMITKDMGKVTLTASRPPTRQDRK